MMSPPWTLPSRFDSVAEAMMPRLTRLYDVGRASVTTSTIASLLMADRPKGSGVPEEGTPEYDWLYGRSSSSASPSSPSSSSDATRQVPAAQRPDETRVMPAVRRDARGGGSGRPPSRPQPTPAGASRPRRRRLPRLGLRLVPLLLLLVVVYLVGVPLWFYGEIDRVDAEPGGDRPADQPGTNYLIVGSDKA